MDEKQRTEQQESPPAGVTGAARPAGEPEPAADPADGAPAADPADGAQADGAPDPFPVTAPVAPEKGGAGGMKPGVVAVLCVALVLVTALVSAAVWRGSSPWVAKVNGEKITQNELYDAMYANIGSDALQNLVTEKLIAQEAKAKKVSVTKEELDERMAVLIDRQFGSQEQFEQLLAMYSMTRADFEDQIRNQLTVEKILEPNIKLTDADLSAYFEDHRDKFHTPRSAEVRHVLVETRAEAEEVRAAIAGGADFAEVAKERSTDEATAAQGGAMGSIRHNEQLPPWLLAAFDLAPGELSEVVEGDNGFHVMEVTGLNPAVTPKFEDVKDEVRQMALEERMMALYPEWLNSLLESADLEYRD